MANSTQSNSSTPDWLAAVKAEAAAAAAADAERIPLRTSAPVPRGPVEPSEKKPTETKRLAGFDNDLIDVKKTPEPKKTVTEPRMPAATDPKKPAHAESPKSTDGKPAFKPDRDIDRPHYPSRLMVPSTVVMACIGTAWVMYAMPYLPAKFHNMEIFAAVPGALGLFQLAKWGYRVLSGGYRVTKTQLIQFAPGPIPDPEPIDLTTIATINVKQSAYEWFMLAGSLQLTFERNSHKDIVLGPVSFPKRRMRLMQQAIDAAREGKVVSGRVAA